MADNDGRPASLKKGALPMDARARTASRALFAGVLVVLSVWIAQGFLAPLGWAAVVAITTWPLYRQFTTLLASQRDSVGPSLVFTFLVGLVLLVPVGLAAHPPRRRLKRSGNPSPITGSTESPRPWLPSLPVVGNQVAQWWRANLSDAKAVTLWIGAADAHKEAARTQGLGVDLLHRFFYSSSR